ncbi:MAG TPA: response regulator [Burkholderiaceae bacterium]|nr:response regulator [Burkholderiaceae bacterium]
MKTILVVEDEYGTSEALAHFLEGEGFGVVLAVNGREGLRKAAERRPDLIVSDFMMPVMNGAEMCARIRATPGFDDIPIVMNSSAEEHVVRAVFADYDVFLRKPYEAAALLPKVIGLVAEGRAVRRTGGDGPGADPAAPPSRPPIEGGGA